MSNAGIVDPEMHYFYSFDSYQNVVLPRFVSPCFVQKYAFMDILHKNNVIYQYYTTSWIGHLWDHE